MFSIWLSFFTYLFEVPVGRHNLLKLYAGFSYNTSTVCDTNTIKRKLMIMIRVIINKMFNLFNWRFRINVDEQIGINATNIFYKIKYVL